MPSHRSEVVSDMCSPFSDPSEIIAHAPDDSDRYWQAITEATDELKTVKIQLRSRDVALAQLSNETLYERTRRITAEANQNLLKIALTHATLMNKLETVFLDGEGWELRHRVSVFLPRWKIAKLWKSDDARNHSSLLKLSALFDKYFYHTAYETSQLPGAALKEYISKGWKTGNAPSVLFDPEYFCKSARIPFPPSRDPVLTFLLQPPGNQSSPHPLFDITYYLSQIPHNTFAARFPLTHYLLIGGFCGLDPHPLFDSDFYLHAYPDVVPGKLNPLVHYLRYGASERRIPHPCFDVEYYLDKVSGSEPETSVPNPLLHFIQTKGMVIPTRYFSPSYYLTQNPDVAKSATHPFLHFTAHGEKEGRDPHPYFSIRHYRQTYPDYLTAGLGPLGHFVRHGESEQRIPYAQFDVSFYKEWHKDETAAQELPFRHFVEHYASGKVDVDEAFFLSTKNVMECNPSFSNSPSLSVVVSATGDDLPTLRSLLSLFRQSNMPRFEVLLVQPVIKPGSEELFSRFSQLRIVSLETVTDVASVRNAAASAARGTTILFLGQGSEVCVNSVQELSGTLSRELDCGAVGGKVLLPTGFLAQAGGEINANGFLVNNGADQSAGLPDYNYARTVSFVSESLLVTKANWERVGGFSSDYETVAAVDRDFALRLASIGLSTIYQPLARFVSGLNIRSQKAVTEDSEAAASDHETLNRKWQSVPESLPNLGYVLFLDATTPTPDRDGGSLLAYYWLQTFRKFGYCVTFVPQDTTRIPDYSQRLEREGIRTVVAPYAHSIEELIKENPGELKFAVIFRHRVGEAAIPLLKKYQPQAKIIFHNVDLHYLRLQRQALLENNGLLAKIAEKEAADELAVHSQADLVHTMSEVEKNEIHKQLPDVWVEISPPIQDCWKSPATFSERKDVCFVGGFRHRPNVDAAIYFAVEIMPLLRARESGIKFIIVGPDAPPEVLALARDDIEVRGFVPDLRELMNSVRLTVAPIRFGAGVKTKVSASMAYAVPTVATPEAIEGMDLTPGENIIVARTPAQFSEEVLRLYTDEQVWQKVAAAAFETAKSRYSKENFSKQLNLQLLHLQASPVHP